jgi:nicotinamidase-related amidase
MAHSFALQESDTALVIIDIQQRLAAAMEGVGLRENLRKVINILECGRLLGLPAVVTEQYPQGLGSTLPMISEAVGRLGPEVSFVEKKRFSCYGVKAFDRWLQTVRRRQLVLCGIETHVCVFQTARDLVSAGYTVHVPADTTLSRQHLDHTIGLDLIKRAGGVVTTSETVVFDLLKVAEGPSFKAMSKMLKAEK